MIYYAVRTCQEDTLCPNNSSAVQIVWRAIQNADEEHDECEDRQTPIIDRSTPVFVDQNPRTTGCDKSNGQESNTHVKGMIRTEASDCTLLLTA